MVMTVLVTVLVPVVVLVPWSCSCVVVLVVVLVGRGSRRHGSAVYDGKALEDPGRVERLRAGRARPPTLTKSRERGSIGRRASIG